jgi:membrane associated rhomboid family serine protease
MFMQFRSLLKAQGVLLLLIAVIFLTFLLQETIGVKFYADYMTVPAEVVSAWDVLRDGDYRNIPWPEFGTLFTAAMLHGGADHIIGNMIFLWIFAALAAELIGQRWMLLTFVFTAIIGSLCHVALNTESAIPCLRASGAVMGFEGLYLAMAVRWRLPDPHVWPMSKSIAPGRLAMIGVLGLIFDFLGYTSGQTGIAYGAHLGGFIGGLFLGSFVVRMPRVALPRR